jgi:signal peptidase II
LNSATNPPSPKRFHWQRWAALFSSAAAVFVIDQSSKAWVTSHLALGESWAPIPAIADYFAILRSANSGAAFSLLPQAGDLFLLVALAMMVGIVVLYPRMPAGHWWERFALGLLLGGVAGNALDRIRLAYVVDFVRLQFRPYISNVSNLADHAIVIGILILLIAQWSTDRARKVEVVHQNEVEQAGEDTPPAAMQ